MRFSASLWQTGGHYWQAQPLLPKTVEVFFVLTVGFILLENWTTKSTYLCKSNEMKLEETKRHC